MKLYINYHTGEGNEIVNGTLAEAKAIADQNAAYTQLPITILDETGREITARPWWGVEYDENECDDQDPICFGSNGYYGDWAD